MNRIICWLFGHRPTAHYHWAITNFYLIFCERCHREWVASNQSWAAPREVLRLDRNALRKSREVTELDEYLPSFPAASSYSERAVEKQPSSSLSTSRE